MRTPMRSRAEPTPSRPPTCPFIRSTCAGVISILGSFTPVTSPVPPASRPLLLPTTFSMPAAMTRTERTIQWICRAVIAFVFALPVFLGAGHGLLDIERNYVLESSLAGAFLIHMRAHPKPAEWLSALGIGSGLTVAYAFWHHGYGSSWEAAPFAYLTFLGTGSLTVLVGQIFFGARVARRLHRDTFFAAAAFPYFSFILAFYLHWTATLQQRTFDLSLYAFDEALQCHPSDSRRTAGTIAGARHCCFARVPQPAARHMFPGRR